MGGSEKSPTARSDSDPSRSVTVISSSDEEGTNKDLIVERHLKRERSEAVDVAFKEEESVGTTDSVITSVNEMPDNAVLRKLLRGPRYFDPGNRDSGACFNCGEEGHPATDCTVKRKEKPCFICGTFGHYAKHCTQGRDCFICKRRGHIAKNCPDKNKSIPLVSIICLRCGGAGHDMLSCKNDFAPDDLKEIQCYVCKNYGHLCCVDSVDSGPRDLSCYNCAQAGHTGQGCIKPRGEISRVSAPTLCYKCGEEGHFARGCTKNSKEGVASTPRRRRLTDEDRDSLGFRSVPTDLKRAKKKKFKEKWNRSGGKSRMKGGCMVDDSGDLSRRQWRAYRSRSHSKLTSKSPKVYSSASAAHYSTSQFPLMIHMPFIGTPNSNAYPSSHQNGYFTPIYHDASQNYFVKM